MQDARRKHGRGPGAILAEAFAKDPGNLWIFGSSAAMTPVFSSLGRGVYRSRRMCHLIGDAGAAMWREARRPEARDRDRKEQEAFHSPLGLRWLP